ncbi:hypothetical protein [Alkaliphilus sp. B6464]|uniref:hypothetical protein n=1 Tax=Alkaliphilus sp. B6464 TaxID=2731219 RepID=UPI001BAD9259|nr:hypothetical protein [Alkaliphilus sp. B6464]QUH22198.1 hypothetical protein HYG84_20030 [Alkaliphilus sp. B6464]
MKYGVKKMIFIMLSTGLILAGCNANNQNLNKDKRDFKLDTTQDIGIEMSIEKDNQVSAVSGVKEEYNKEMAELFPTKEGTTWYYQGLAEYGHVMTLKKVTNEGSKLMLDIEGYLDDAVEEAKPDGPRSFKLQYVIDKDGVTEHILYNATKEKTFYSTSIIPDKVILNGSLEVGTSWEQDFEYDGKKHKAITTISKLEKMGEKYVGNPIFEGQIQYTTTTIVKGIEGFKDNIYKEERSYIADKGLVGFTKTLGMYKDEKGQMVDFGFDFGYGLGIIKSTPDELKSDPQITENSVEETKKDTN